MTLRGPSRRDAWAAVLAQPRVQAALEAERKRRETAGSVQAIAPAARSGEVPSGSRMTKTEERFAARLRMRKETGAIRDYQMHAITVLLDDPTQPGRKGCRYSPDALVVHLDGSIELAEVKGAYVREDAKLKFRWARQAYPCFRWTWNVWARGEWTVSEGP